MELKMSTLMLIAFTIGSGMLTARSQTNKTQRALRIGVYDPRYRGVFTHIGNRTKPWRPNFRKSPGSPAWM